jgi:hypothetical protein
MDGTRGGCVRAGGIRGGGASGKENITIQPSRMFSKFTVRYDPLALPPILHDLPYN